MGPYTAKIQGSFRCMFCLRLQSRVTLIIFSKTFTEPLWEELLPPPLPPPPPPPPKVDIKKPVFPVLAVPCAPSPASQSEGICLDTLRKRAVVISQLRSGLPRFLKKVKKAKKAKKEANRATAQETHLLRTIPVVPDEDRPVAVAPCEERVCGRPACVPGP